ncbi:MAG: alpha-amylase family glycosyl hydrolase [Acidimicrobiia bacterium]
MSAALVTIRQLWNELYDGQHQEGLEAFAARLEQFKSEHALVPLPNEWYKDVVVYSLYVDLFNENFEGLIEKLDYLDDLGVSCLWLLPILESPMKDAGFDISDYTKVRDDLAVSKDRSSDQVFDDFVQEAHRRGIAIIFDIALNHSSIEHPWFQSSRDDKSSPYRDYYIWSDTDDLYREARVIFKGMMDSNWTRHGDQFYFHRFFDIQPDLNYRNPNVLVEMTMILLGWLARGVDGFRADAVPYLWKEAGTNCENLPKTHIVVKILRAATDYLRPGTVLVAEANQPPQEVAAYFGDGDECSAAYHFPLMPRMYRAIAQADRRAITDTLSADFTPPIPASCQWFTFLRCHDELTLEMVTPEERQLIYDYYVRDPLWDFRRGEGISSRLAPLLGNDPRRVNLLNAILLTLIGTPIIYYGDEVAKGNDRAYYDQRVAETGYPDSRNLARGPMNWDVIESDLANSASLASQVFFPLKALIARRRSSQTFSRGQLDFVDVGDNRVLIFTRTLGADQVLIMANLSDQTVNVAAAELAPFDFTIRP